MWKLAILLTFLFSKVLAHRHVTCYYRNWSQYGRGKARFLPEDIDPTICSVIKFAFMRVNHETYELEATKPNDEKMLMRINALKKINPSLKVVIAVGGWRHENVARFSKMVYTKEARETFIRSAIEFLTKYELDGLSYNWLYPAIRPKKTVEYEKEQFTVLLKETYEAFKKEQNCFQLSATVSSSVRKIPMSYEVKKIAKYVDNVDVIVHSLWGYWKRKTGSPSAMKGDQPTVVESIEAWLKSGMPAEKINIGFALYGRTFQLESHSSYQLGDPTIGPGEEGEHTRSKGVLAYYEICSREWTHITEWVTSKTEAPFVSRGDLWVAYDNPSSFKYKIQYLLQKYKLYGVTLWAMDLDDFSGSFCNDGKYPLIRRIYAAMEEVNVPRPVVSCDMPVDLGFILDSSGSLRHEYSKEKDFLKAIAASFGLRKNGSRAGVVTFSYDVEHSIKLNDYYNTFSFNAAVDAIPLMGHTTRIDRSLRLVQKAMFTEENGARDDTPKLLVLLTDGSQTPDVDAEHPGFIADEIRSSGINIIVVGIGSGTNATELTHLAGGSENLFLTPSFEHLLGSDLMNRVKERSCPAEIRVEIPKPVKMSCEAVVDLGFILDSSSSIQNNYQSEKEFLKSLAAIFGVSEYKSRAAVITFSKVADHSIKLKDHRDIYSFNSEVDAIPLMGSITRIDKAFRLAQREIFTTENGARPGIPKILILLTDGYQTPAFDAEHPATIAGELRRSGITLIIVGMGPGINRYELTNIAGGDRVFRAAFFSDLLTDWFLDSVQKKVCAVLRPCTR